MHIAVVLIRIIILQKKERKHWVSSKCLTTSISHRICWLTGKVSTFKHTSLVKCSKHFDILCSRNVLYSSHSWSSGWSKNKTVFDLVRYIIHCEYVVIRDQSKFTFNTLVYGTDWKINEKSSWIRANIFPHTTWLCR